VTNLGTTDYIEAAAAAGLVWYGLKKSGLEKWALLGLSAYLLYGVYQDYSAAPTAA
jgi:uncharacterized membrane protein